jgi:hypothetical protein
VLVSLRARAALVRSRAAQSSGICGAAQNSKRVLRAAICLCLQQQHVCAFLQFVCSVHGDCTEAESRAADQKTRGLTAAAI